MKERKGATPVPAPIMMMGVSPVLRQAEVGVGFDKDADFAAFFEAFAQVAGCCTGVGVVVVVETDHAYGKMDFFADFALCRGNGVKARGLWAEEAV